VSVFGHCMTREHQACKKEFERWYIGPVGTGRKKKQGIIYTGEIVECDCTCHGKGKK
jgi:hypothetical protein